MATYTAMDIKLAQNFIIKNNHIIYSTLGQFIKKLNMETLMHILLKKIKGFTKSIKSYNVSKFLAK